MALPFFIHIPDSVVLINDIKVNFITKGGGARSGRKICWLKDMSFMQGITKLHKRGVYQLRT